MTYVPRDPALFSGPFAPSQGLTPLWANHDEVADAYQQALGGYFGELATTADTPMVWRFRCRANAGLRQVRVTYDFVRLTGAGTFTVTLASSSASAVGTHSVDGPLVASLTVDVPAADAELTLTLVRSSGEGTAALRSFRPFALTGSFSGFIGASGGGRWEVAEAPVNVEHIGRLLNGPVQIAQDAPHCLFSHFAPDLANLGAMKDKTSFRFWGLSGTTTDAGAMTRVGRGLVGVSGPQARTVTIDSYIEAATGADAETLLSIGGWSYSPGLGRDRVTMTLTPGFHEVVASLSVATDKEAVWQSLQVWRL